jgi:hypothetical protein
MITCANHKFSIWQIRCALAFIFLVLLQLPLYAQSSPIAERLPPGTIFYVEWRGKAFLADADKQNHLLQLLEDPDFAPLRQLAMKNLQQSVEKQPAGAKPVTLDDIVSLLDNPSAFGVVANPVPSQASATGEASSPVSVFLVYDATGKRELIQKLKSSSRNKDASAVSTYHFGDTPVEIQTTGKDTSYTAFAADYFLFADQKSVIEDLIVRFRSHFPPTSVAQLPEYQSVRKNFDPNAAIEYFAHVPDLNALIPQAQKEKPGFRVLQGLHLDRIHALAGSISFAGAATHFQGEIIGDTSPGSLFDLAGPSSSTFATQPLAGQNLHLSVSRVNLAALYKVIRGAIIGGMPKEQVATFTAGETAAEAYLGMPIADALGLFTGEFASTSSFADDGTELSLYALTIRKPEEVLRVVRAVGATKLVAEDSSGDTTFLDFAFSYNDPGTGHLRKKFYYVAVTPQMLLIAPRKAMLRDAIQRLNSSSAAPASGGIFENPDYLQLRARLPEKLSGLSGSELSQIPWEKVFANFMTQIEAGMKSQGQASTNLDWLKLVKPEVASRHLHMAVGGWWKDANGIHFDSYVQ